MRCAKCGYVAESLYHECQPEDIQRHLDAKRFRFLCEDTVELFSFGGDPEEIREAIDAAMAKQWPVCRKCRNVMDGATRYCPDNTLHIPEPETEE